MPEDSTAKKQSSLLLFDIYHFLDVMKLAIVNIGLLLSVAGYIANFLALENSLQTLNVIILALVFVFYIIRFNQTRSWDYILSKHQTRLNQLKRQLHHQAQPTPNQENIIANATFQLVTFIINFAMFYIGTFEIIRTIMIAVLPQSISSVILSHASTEILIQLSLLTSLLLSKNNGEKLSKQHSIEAEIHDLLKRIPIPSHHRNHSNRKKFNYIIPPCAVSITILLYAITPITISIYSIISAAAIGFILLLTCHQSLRKKSQAHITACNSMASALGAFCKIVEMHPKTFLVLHRVSTRFSLLRFITAPLLSILAIVYGIETYHNERAKHSTEIALTHLEKYAKSAKQRHPQCTTIKKISNT